jgi:hypothetical protein
VARPHRLWPYAGVAIGAALLVFPAMVPSVWAAMSEGGFRDFGTSDSQTQEVGTALASGAPATTGSLGSISTDDSSESELSAANPEMTPEMQSVVFRPTSATIEGELIAIQRRVPTTRRTVRATDTAVRALGRYLATIGYENGRLPASALRRSTTGCRMYAPAAVAYDAMAAAASEAGFRLEHSGCYRTYQQQVLLRQARCAQNRCKFAAVPGTSMHGWGLAVDFKIGNRALDYRDPLFAWLSANAGRFGYVHPQWARQGGNLQEPWHWEYGLLTASASQSVTDPNADPTTTVPIVIGEDEGKLADADEGSDSGDLEVEVDPEDPDADVDADPDPETGRDTGRPTP